MILSSLYQQKTVKTYQKLLAKNTKNRCIGISTKQRIRVKMRQISKDILSNQTL